MRFYFFFKYQVCPASDFQFDFGSAVSAASAAVLHLQLLDYTALILSGLHNVVLIFTRKLIYLGLQFSVFEGDEVIWTGNKGSNSVLKPKQSRERAVWERVRCVVPGTPLARHAWGNPLLMERKVRSSVAMTVAFWEEAEEGRQRLRSGYVALRCTVSACQPWINLCFPSVWGRKKIPSDPHTKYMYIFTSILDLN